MSYAFPHNLQATPADTFSQMRWLQNLFMDPYQRKLTDPKLYHQPFNAAEIKEELANVRDHESRMFMNSALTDASDKNGNVTLARVVDQMESVRGAMRWELDRSMREFGVGAIIGGEFLAGHLIHRANALAASIQTGAKQSLGDAI